MILSIYNHNIQHGFDENNQDLIVEVVVRTLSKSITQ